MDFISSERLKNFIIFSYIKDFVIDLCNVYDDNEQLVAYKHFINDSNILTETSDFVEGFKPCLDGKNKAYYCEGVYINIPKFLSKNDENKHIIEDYLKKISNLYDHVEQCKELVFLKNYSENFGKDIDYTKEENQSEEHYIKKILDNIKPDVQKTQQAFKDQNLNVERFLKIILVIAYEKVDSIPMLDSSDSLHIKNIINIVANTPLNKLASRKLDLMKEFMSIKNIQNVPFKNIFGDFKF